jgi:hypothetical protein
MTMRTFERHTPTSLAVVDTKTGEIFSEGVKFVGTGDKYLITGGYAIVALVFFSKLAELKLPADAYRLCARIMASANFGGMVNKPNDEYAEEIGIDKTRVSRLIGVLHNKGVIHRIGPKTIFINPAYLFRGTVEAQKQACAEWQKLRLPRLVKFSNKQSA